LEFLQRVIIVSLLLVLNFQHGLHLNLLDD
jgi:hypothetical protein